jgi:hypothetical protein
MVTVVFPCAHRVCCPVRATVILWSPCLPPFGVTVMSSGFARAVMVKAFGNVTTSVPVVTVTDRGPGAAAY